MDVMHAGLPEFLALPLEPQCVTDCLGRLKEKRSRRVVSMQQSELLYSFLPAKPGCGATTLAVNSTLAVTRHHDATGLLMDFDLNSGMIRFMLKLSSTHSILDAAEYGASMDQKLWRQIATRYERLDVVHSGTLNPEIRVDDINIRHLLDFARRNYKVVTADLSGNLEKYSMEIMHESRSVFLVCTPELASLHLAREKLQYLNKMGLGDRVRLLLNRYSRRSSILPSEVEEVVGAPVMMTFPNDYACVVDAMTEGTAVEATSDLGQACDGLGAYLAKRKAAKPVEPRRKFVEYLNLTPGRFASERTKT
jgi:pilus assembly protein CpaE